MGEIIVGGGKVGFHCRTYAPTLDSLVPPVSSFSITVITWNVGTAMPPSDVTSLLHLNTGDSADTDMIAIG